MPPKRLEALKAIHDEAHVVIRAAEDWAPGFRDAPKEWHDLIRLENRLLRSIKGYFRELAANRINDLVNASEYQNRLIQATDVTVTIDSSQSQAEVTILLGVLIDEIHQGMTLGAMSARTTYTRWIGQAMVNDLISQQAIDHAGELAKGLTETTLNDVRASIELSIKSGEDLAHAVARLRTIITKPSRAEMIARTETVRAYSAGIVAYGKQTGAVTKTWQALPGADEGGQATPCVDNANQDPIGIDDDFDSGDPFPPAHPYCRCYVVLQYETNPNGDVLPLDIAN